MRKSIKWFIGIILIVLLGGSCGLPAVYQQIKDEDYGDAVKRGGIKSRPAAARSHVALVEARSFYTSHYGIGSVNRSFTIRVKNSAYDKTVAVHHRKKDGSWLDLNAYYYDTAEDGYETWKASISWNSQYSGAYTYGEEFAVKYTVNGSTYWDNNNGNNYHMVRHAGVLLGEDTNVRLYHAGKYSYSGKTVLFCAVSVKNIDYDKTVKIIYTTDNWNTTETVDAKYNSMYFPSYSSPVNSPNANGVEHWSYSIEKPGEGHNFEFAVSYELNGVTYWDNNYGRNFCR